MKEIKDLIESLKPMLKRLEQFDSGEREIDTTLVEEAVKVFDKENKQKEALAKFVKDNYPDSSGYFFFNANDYHEKEESHATLIGECNRRHLLKIIREINKLLDDDE